VDTVFDRYRALSLDCYGTLIDWEAGIAAELAAFALRHGIDAGADVLLDVFARCETVVQIERPEALYPAALAESLRRIGRRFGVGVADGEAEDFGASVGRRPAFPDSAQALGRLAQRYRLIILSNVDGESFTASNRHLSVTFDLVLTAQDIGSYKPDRCNVEALLATMPGLGVGEGELLHVAQSVYHDHEPANAVGLPTVWIDRWHDRPGFGATRPRRARSNPTGGPRRSPPSPTPPCRRRRTAERSQRLPAISVRPTRVFNKTTTRR
jgi:2-haloacid dehalogenase